MDPQVANGFVRGEMAMRTFSCFASRARSDVPTLSIILAETDARARILVRRELLDDKDALSVEVCEGGKPLWTEWR